MLTSYLYYDNISIELKGLIKINIDWRLDILF